MPGKTTAEYYGVPVLEYSESKSESGGLFPMTILNWRIEMKIRPLNDRVLVVGIEEKEKTTGGIIIPDSAKEKPQEGKVVAVGPGKWDENGKRIPLEVKKGNRVLFGKYVGNEIKIDGVEHLIMREDDILGIIEK
jgi:chaperonin GroES